MTTGESAVYEFGDFRMDVRERQLSRNGRPITLTGKVFDTLRIMLERAGRLVTKDELMQHLWPDTVVEENNLNQNISALRRALGEQTGGPRFIETVPRAGYRFVAGVRVAGVAVPEPTSPSADTRRQEIRFCTTADHTRIAYATVGSGPPLAKTANWLTHLEHEWDSPVWRHWIHAMSRHHQVVRWDERGTGLSDWNVEHLGLDAWVGDMETVVDAAGLERFALLGISQGGAVATAYAARHPDRVSHLVLCGAYARGWRFRNNPADTEARTALLDLTRLGWGQKNPTFRQLFTSRFIPDAGAAEMEWFSDLQRVSTSPENAARLMDAFSYLDVRSLLHTVKAPTIVFHAREDGVVPFEEGRLLAAGIPNSTLVPLPSRNHLILEREPAWDLFLRELGSFLGWRTNRQGR
jgi:DNA-binding winged helix-turn-helix (wHTH) protein/alpha-beta hydrolase superfamily lysophospholipase